MLGLLHCEGMYFPTLNWKYTELEVYSFILLVCVCINGP